MKITRGITTPPIFAVVYGEQKIGKTSFCAAAPEPLVIDCERGSLRLDVDRVECPDTFDGAMSLLDEITTSAHEYKTLVCDPLSAFEQVIFARVIADEKKGSKSIGQVAGGYGKGEDAALPYWLQFLKKLELMREKRGMHILLIDHVKTAKHKNPEGDDYNYYSLAINDKAASIVLRSVEAVLFARMVKYTSKKNAKDLLERARVQTTGERVISTHRAAAYEAGNRYGLPDEIPLDWSAFWAAYIAPTTVSALKEQAALLAGQLTDLAFIERATVKINAETDATRLRQMISTLQAKVRTTEEATA